MKRAALGRKITDLGQNTCSHSSIVRINSRAASSKMYRNHCATVLDLAYTDVCPMHRVSVGRSK